MKYLSLVLMVGFMFIAGGLVLAAPQEEVRTTVEDFQQAIKAGQYDEARNLLTPQLQKLLDSSQDANQLAGGKVNFLHQDMVNFLKNELEGNSYQECQIAGITVQEKNATVDLKPAAAKMVKLYLAQTDQGWRLSVPAANPLKNFEAEGEATIQKDQAQMKNWQRQEKIDQDIADDVNADRFRR